MRNRGKIEWGTEEKYSGEQRKNRVRSRGKKGRDS